jgi:DUF2927 family protein
VRASALVGIAVIGVVASGAALKMAQAENRHIAKLRAAEQKTFTDAQIIDGFFKTAFGAELAVAGRADRIRKYEGPVRVFVESRAKPTGAGRSPTRWPISPRGSITSTSR